MCVLHVASCSAVGMADRKWAFCYVRPTSCARLIHTRVCAMCVASCSWRGSTCCESYVYLAWSNEYLSELSEEWTLRSSAFLTKSQKTNCSFVLFVFAISYFCHQLPPKELLHSPSHAHLLARSKLHHIYTIHQLWMYACELFPYTNRYAVIYGVNTLAYC